MKTIKMSPSRERITNPLFDEILDHIASRMILHPEKCCADNGSGYSTLVYNGSETVMNVQFFRSRPVRVTAVIRGVEVGTMLYTDEDVPGLFAQLLPAMM